VPSFLDDAINVESLIVEMLSPDILEVIQRRQENPERFRSLDCLKVTKYFETMRDLDMYPSDEEDDWNDAGNPERPSFSGHLSQIGTHWKKLAIGDKAQRGWYAEEARSLLEDFLPTCIQLVELSFPATNEHLVSFQTPCRIFSDNLRILFKQRYFLCFPNYQH
jgi:hypothetical protein